VHIPVAKSTLCTADDGTPCWSNPPMRSTCPCSLSLSSIATATDVSMGPHDSGGRTFQFFSSASESSYPKISTLAMFSSYTSSDSDSPSSPSTTPPSTTTPPLTAQHA
jgi:hypothetical protein